MPARSDSSAQAATTFGIALASLVPGVGLVFLMWWLIAVGIKGILIACAGLLFEHYTGARRAH